MAILSAIAGLAGGWLALSKRIKPNLTLGFTAGALIGLVAFGLLPEIVELNEGVNLALVWAMGTLVVGFLTIHIIEKTVLIHQPHEGSYKPHLHPFVGVASALALIVHSFLDGLSIGVAFQIDNKIGVAVSLAVIGHRFADGFNIATLTTRSNKSRSTVIKMVVAGAAAPILGSLTSLIFTFPVDFLYFYLSFFAGFILYIGASDILPQAHSRRTSYGTILATVLGVVFMLLVTQLA